MNQRKRASVIVNGVDIR